MHHMGVRYRNPIGENRGQTTDAAAGQLLVGGRSDGGAGNILFGHRFSRSPLWRGFVVRREERYEYFLPTRPKIFQHTHTHTHQQKQKLCRTTFHVSIAISFMMDVRQVGLPTLSCNRLENNCANIICELILQIGF